MRDTRGRDIGRARHFIALACAAAAFIILIGASIAVCAAFLVDQPLVYDVSTQQADAVGYATGLLWPTAVVAIGTFGTVALIARQRRDKVLWLMFLCVLGLACGIAYSGAWSVITPTLPLRGMAAVFLVVLFTCIDTGALYCMWRYIIRL